MEDVSPLIKGESKSRVYGRVKETQRVAVIVDARDQPRALNGRSITRLRLSDS